HNQPTAAYQLHAILGTAGLRSLSVFRGARAMVYSPATTSIFARGPAIPTTAAIPWAPLAGRILLSTIFVLSGLTKLTDWHGTAAYMAAHGLPLVPVLLPFAAIVEITGGLAIQLGSKSRLAALVLFLYLIP